MITREEAERIAERWVAAATPGREFDVREFDLGYVVSADQPLFGRGRGIIDKDTAELSVWAQLPVEIVLDQYRERQARRPPRESTWDRAEQARWEIDHPTVPATVTNLGMTSPLTNEPISIHSVLGDAQPYHHRLVVDFFHNTLSAAHRVRGYDRCSEAAAISDVLHAEDARRRAYREPLITLEQARALFGGVEMVTYRQREFADPLGGQDAPHCLSCTMLARYFGFPLDDPRPGDAPVPDVAEVLRVAGWSAGRRIDPAPILDFVRDKGDPDTEPIVPFAAATAVIAEYGDLSVEQDGPGVDLRRRPFRIDPKLVYGTGDTLSAYGKLLGVRLFPIGTDGDQDSILAVDEARRMCAIDHAGTWLLGETINAALAALVTGAQPLRLDSRGNWCPPPPNAPH